MIGDRLRALREDKDMTRQQLATVLKVSVHTVKSYEYGNSAPDDDLKITIAEFFGVSVDYLLGFCDCKRRYEDTQPAIVVPHDLNSEDLAKIQEYADMVVSWGKVKV